VFAIFGVVLALIGVMAVLGFRVPGVGAGVSPMMIVVTPWLLASRRRKNANKPKSRCQFFLDRSIR